MRRRHYGGASWLGIAFLALAVMRLLYGTGLLR